MNLDYPPGATPLDPDEAAGLITAPLFVATKFEAFADRGNQTIPEATPGRACRRAMVTNCSDLTANQRMPASRHDLAGKCGRSSHTM